jgi:hypothetical protein
MGCEYTAMGCEYIAMGCEYTAMGCEFAATGCKYTAMGCEYTATLGSILMASRRTSMPMMKCDERPMLPNALHSNAGGHDTYISQLKAVV